MGRLDGRVAVITGAGSGIGAAASRLFAAEGPLLALTRSLAAELSPEGIRVNAICAGTVDTPMARPLLELRGEGDAARGAAVTAERYPIGRIGSPDDIARAALFLASDESS